MQRVELDTYLNQYLDVARFRDYCPNGLQVEGRARVEWSGRFTPRGVSDEEASQLFGGIYRDGLAALAQAFQESRDADASCSSARAASA